MTRAALAGLAALVLASGASAAARSTFINLPSPLAPLSPAPPLGGGATSSSEGFRHRIDARTIVEVSIDPSGTPFAIHATQRLDVRVKGDYFFTIGAPLLDVEAAPGSAASPGLRATAIIWAGFNPGRRLLAARATLAPVETATLLPLRVTAEPGRVTLTNTTAVTANAYRANAVAAPLRAYLRLLKSDVERGRPPTAGIAYVTDTPAATHTRIVVPLRVTGSVGGHRVDALVEDRLVIHGAGAVRLRVVPALPRALLDAPTTGLSGRQLLDRATQTTLTLARLRQFETFLGNPDPAGASGARFVYRTASKPVPPVVAAAPHSGRDWPTTIAVALGLLLLAAAAAVTWSRS